MNVVYAVCFSVGLTFIMHRNSVEGFTVRCMHPIKLDVVFFFFFFFLYLPIQCSYYFCTAVSVIMDLSVFF